MAELANISKYRIDAKRAWVRLKVKSRSPAVLQVLRATAGWREEMAAKKDVPRQRILKDDYVVQIAMQMPKTIEELHEVRGIQGQLSKESMAALVEVIVAALAEPKENFPQPEERERPMPAAQDACLDQLKLLLRQKAEDYHVVPRLVADKAELEAVVRGKLPLEKAHFGHGWRYDVFGAAAKDLLAGKLTARVHPHRGGYGLVWSV
jgi:ribonuclease D